MTDEVFGWGRTSRVATSVATVSSVVDAQQVTRRGHSRGVIARGLGRSYGDSAQNAGGVTADCTALNEVLRYDESDKTVTVRGGCSLADIGQALLSRGRYLPVVPGTAHVTVGGAIAADIHGKNHHQSGTFGTHVKQLTLVDGLGEVHQLTPTDPRFWATVGGMGLTGIIVEATIGTIEAGFGAIDVTETRSVDLEETMAYLESADEEATYSVAWVDLARKGRGVVQFGSQSQQTVSASKTAGRTLPVPALPVGALRRSSISALNAAWWLKAPRTPKTAPMRFGSFFFPLDAATGWPGAYGPAGFTQWQVVLPFDQVQTLHAVVERLGASPVPPALSVLKRFGAQNKAPLSFPKPGWTLAVDLPAYDYDTAALLDELDEDVVCAGGRIYLAKDARMPPAHMTTMYPRLNEWRELRSELDPAGVFRSDQSTRLGLT